MHQKNVIPALISSALIPNLSDNGLLVLTGAHGVYKEPTSSMIAYALAKTTIHSLTLQLEMPNKAAVITILPEVIDTPSNREAMPKSDFSKWANPD